MIGFTVAPNSTTRSKQAAEANARVEHAATTISSLTKGSVGSVSQHSSGNRLDGY